MTCRDEMRGYVHGIEMHSEERTVIGLLFHSEMTYENETTKKLHPESIKILQGVLKISENSKKNRITAASFN